jgi:methionine-rich copper-binding protein CopC
MHLPRSRPLLATAVLLGVLAGSGAATVLAHAELDTVTPADKSSVSAVPAEVVMTFTEPLKPANSSIKLVNTSNQVVADGSTVDATDPKTMRLRLPGDLPIGTYTARWTSASALDGDLDHGTTSFTFAVGPEPGSPSPTATIAPSGSASPSATAIAASAVASAPPATPATSTGDLVIPIVVALILLAALGAWLLRGRARSPR